jgi:hypothetical protein
MTDDKYVVGVGRGPNPVMKRLKEIRRSARAAASREEN